MTTNKIALTLSWDAEADAGYIDTSATGSDRSVARSVPIKDQDDRLYGAMDLAADGTLLGIEILGVGTLLPGARG